MNMKIAAITLMGTTALGSAALAQMTTDNQLSDPRVRQAMAYAIDMDTIAETLFEGAAIPAHGLLPKGPNLPDDLNPYSYDPDRARELLAEAGWDSGRVLDVAFYYDDQQTADFMAAIQAYWADVGIQMNYRLLEGDVGAQLNALPEDSVNGPSAVTWDVAYGARAALALQEYFNQFVPGQMATVPDDPEMAELVAGINGTPDPLVQRDYYHQLERIINEKVYILPLYYQQLYAFNSDRIERAGHDVGNEQFQYAWGIEDWTIEGDPVAYTNGAPAQFFEIPWQNLGIFALTKLSFDTLLSADANLTPNAGELAESWEVSEDGLTVTLHMRDGITWHDGDPITVDDVVWSFETAARFPITHPVVKNTLRSLVGGEAFAAGEGDHIEGISTDGNTITLSFDRVDPNVLLSLSQFSPLPASYFQGVDPIKLQDSSFWQFPVGSGPYMVEDVQMNDYTTFVPFEGYWNGTANIERIVALPSYDSDPNLLRNAQAGRLDFGYTKNAHDAVALGEMDGMEVYPVDIPYTRMMWINEFPHP